MGRPGRPARGGGADGGPADIGRLHRARGPLLGTWMRGLPVSRQLLLINAVFAGMVLVLLVVGAFGMMVLSTIRAYVGGEGLWAKGVDHAVSDLFRYASTGDPSRYTQYRQSLAVPLGDREARLELEKPHVDYRVVQQGFAQGGNSPADTLSSALMLRWFHSFGYFHQAVVVWRRADGYVLRLQHLGSELHVAVAAGGAGSARVKPILRRIDTVNSELNPVENSFSAILGEAARWMVGALLWGLAGAAALCLAAGSLSCYLMWRLLQERLERLRQASLRIADGDLSSRVDVEVHDEVGSVADTFNRMADALARARAEVEAKNIELLRGANQERDLIMETVPDLIYVVDAEGRLVRWNRHLEEATGLSGADLGGLPVTDIFVREDRPVMAQALDSAAQKGAVQVEARIGRDGSTPQPYEWTGAPLRRPDGRLIGLAGAGRDIAERKAFEQELTRRAFHDTLTGLPNRAVFFNRLEQAVVRAERYRHTLGVLFVDLDRFKNTNDTLGHEAGDQLLQALGQRVQACLRPGDTVARLGGDEFSVLMEDTGKSEAMRAAQRIAAALKPPFEVQGQQLFVAASVGICLAEPGESATARDLLRRADLAMYEAKRQGRGRFAFFSADMGTRVAELFTLENDLRRAPERGELQVVYQPILDLQTGRIMRAEALLRWHHPTRGLLMPDDFIPVAEETGLIVPLGRWVLEEACREVARWPEAAGLQEPVTVGVNLSAGQVRDARLLDEVQRVLRQTGLPPGCLTLEITEGTVMRDEALTLRILRRLKEIGARIAIDDFGTGYASLHYLKRLPVDDVKIDRSFVRDVDKNTEDAAIVRSVVDLVRALNLSVTAEGVETAAVLRSVRSLGCDEAQGFFIGRPLPASEAMDLMRPASRRAGGRP